MSHFPNEKKLSSNLIRTVRKVGTLLSVACVGDEKTAMDRGCGPAFPRRILGANYGVSTTSAALSNKAIVVLGFALIRADIFSARSLLGERSLCCVWWFPLCVRYPPIRACHAMPRFHDGLWVYITRSFVGEEMDLSINVQI